MCIKVNLVLLDVEIDPWSLYTVAVYATSDGLLFSKENELQYSISDKCPDGAKS